MRVQLSSRADKHREEGLTYFPKNPDLHCFVFGHFPPYAELNADHSGETEEKLFQNLIPNGENRADP